MLYSRGYNWNKVRRAAVAGLKKIGFDGLLSGAWFHKKEPTYEVVDETPSVDTSRTWHKARALQFNNAESVVVSNLQLCNSALSTWKAEFEFVHTYDGNGGYLFDTRYSNDGAQSPGNGAYIQFINNAFSVSGSGGGGITSQPLTVDVRYYGYLEFDGSVLRLFYKGDDGSTETLTANPTQQASGQNFYIGRRHDNSSLFRNLLGWMRITQDNIVTAEYAFEEGEGTICYNRVMNNFHGTINNATISTFRIEDIRITNGDQGTFLNTDGYSPLNIYTSDFTSENEDMAEVNGTGADGQSIAGVDDAYKFTLSGGAVAHYTRTDSAFDRVSSYDVSFDYYIPSGQTIDGIRVRTGTTSDGEYDQTTLDAWTSVAIKNWTPTSKSTCRFNALVGSSIDPIDANNNVFYLKNIVVTQTNLYVPRPRVTDIPLYNAGKYAYYIPDHSNNYIDLNTAFAGLTNDGDWMEFGIATVGTGKPDNGYFNWALSIDGSDASAFFARIDDTDFRIFGPANSYRMQVNANLTNLDFYSFRVTKNYNTTNTESASLQPPPGLLEVFDRDGNLIDSRALGTYLGNEGTYTFDRFFPNTYSTDFILAYLKLSDGTVWNGANDFNGGVNITNTGTGNVTKIFFESVDEDVLGNPLTYKGQVAQPLSLVNSNGAYLETPHKVDFSQIDVSDFTLTFYAYLDSSLSGSGTNREILSNQNTTQGLLYFSDARLYYFAGGHNNSYDFSSAIPDEEVVDKWQKFSIIRNDSANTLSFVVENDSRTVTTDPAQSGAVAPYNMIGRMYSTPGLGGSLAWVSLHSKAMTIEEARAIDPYNMDTDSLEIFLVPSVGSGSTVYDVSGNNNHGTIVNATLSNFWIKQDQFHWNLKKGFDYYTRFADDVNQVQYNEQLPALQQDQTYTIRTQFYFGGFPYPDTLNRVESVLFSANINSTQKFAIWIEGNNSSATFNVGYHDGSNYHTVSLLSPMEPGPYYLEIVKNSPGYDFSSITLNGDSIDVNQAGANFTTIIYQTGIGCRAVDASADRRWYGGVKFFEVVGEHYLSEDNGFVDTIGNLTLDVANTNISTQKDRIPYAPPGRTLSNPAGKWHNDAETEINFPHTAKLQVINEQFDYKPFFYKNAQLDDATAAYSMRKVIADYEGPLLNVIRSSDLQAQDFYPDSRGDLDTAAITSFVNEATPVLDDYSGAAAAYSLRKLRSAYTGSAIEVRRSSNGDTLNIGFDANGDLDSTALLAFVNEDVDVYTSDFSSTEDLSESNGTGSAAQSVGGVDDAYKFTTITGTGQMFAYVQPFSGKGGGNEFRLQGDVYLPSTNTEIDKVRIFTSYGGETYADITTTDSWVSVDQTLTITNGSALRFQAFDGNDITPTTTEANAFYLKNIVVTQTTADGAVTTFYDQTQNDPVNQKNATQSDPAKMPLVVSGGTLVTENGKAAISFDGNDDELVIASSQSEFNQLHDGSNSTIIAVSTLSANSRFLGNDASSSSNIGFDLGYTSDIAHFIREGSGAANRPVVNIGGGVYSTNNQYLLFIDVDADNATADNRSSIYIDGGTPIKNNTSTASPSASDATFDLSIGSAGNNILNNNGKTQEIIIYLSDQSANRTGIESNIGRYYTIDGFADGRVATWYDQANANHATNTTPDEQPLIVNDGVLVTENGKAAINADGSNVLQTATGAIGSVSALSVFSVLKYNVTGANNDMAYGSTSSAYGAADSYFFLRQLSGNFEGKLNDATQVSSINLGTADTSQYLFSHLFVGGSKHELVKNGTSTSDTTDIPSTLNLSQELEIFSALGTTLASDMKLQELIIFNSDQSTNRQDIEKNIADYYDITISGNAGVESWIKNVSFADMYQIWYDYEYLHRLFANFEIPNKVFKVLAYTSELTAAQKQQVYDYLQKNYHPIYTPYSTRVLADGGTLAAGQTNTLTIIDSI